MLLVAVLRPTCILVAALPVPQVALALDGTIYVADGYCNRRAVKFAADGQYLGGC